MTNNTTRLSGEQNLDHLEALARAATPGPWAWWTSNSVLRLTGDDGIDGGVLHAYARRDHADICCGESDRAFIAAANPAAVLELIALARRAAPVSAPIAGDAPLRAALDMLLNDYDVRMVLSASQFAQCESALANQPAPTAAPEQVAQGADDLTDEDQRLVARGMERWRKGIAGECRLPPAGWNCTRTPGHEGPCAAVPQPSEAAPLGYVERAQLEWLARNTSETASIQLWRAKAPIDAVAVYRAAPSLPAAASAKEQGDAANFNAFINPNVDDLAASLSAAAPAPLDADEMTRLRRLMKALGYADSFRQDEKFVRGIMCTVLGQAAGVVEGTLPGPAAAPAAGDELTVPRELLARCLTSMKHAVSFGETGRGRPPQQTCMFEIEELTATLAHQPAQEQASTAQQRMDAHTTSYHQGYQAGIEMGKALATDEAAQEQAEPVTGIPVDLFCARLIENHEGEPITEEGLQFALAEMLTELGPILFSQAAQHEAGAPRTALPDGWEAGELPDRAIVYTDEQMIAYGMAEAAAERAASPVVRADLSSASHKISHSSNVSVVRAQSEESSGLAAMIHYPKCWDTAAYPTIADAMREVAAYACTECAQQAHAGADEVELREQLARAILADLAPGRTDKLPIERVTSNGAIMRAAEIVRGHAAPTDRAAIRAAQEGGAA